MGCAVRRIPAALRDRAVSAVAAGEYRRPAVRRAIALATSGVRHRDVTIPFGVAAGLRFNAAGGAARFVLGVSEPHVQTALSRLLRPGATFYDVGANVGFYSVLAARLVAPAGQVHAFEPLAANVRAARRNAAMNDGGRITVWPCAATAVDGARRLAVGREPFWGTLVPERRPAFVSGASVTVEGRSIDALVADGLDPPDVVKVDVEGSEHEVLLGMRETIRRRRPALLIEVHGTRREVEAELAALGYRVVTLERRRAARLPARHHVLALPTGRT